MSSSKPDASFGAFVRAYKKWREEGKNRPSPFASAGAGCALQFVRGSVTVFLLCLAGGLVLNLVTIISGIFGIILCGIAGSSLVVLGFVWLVYVLWRTDKIKEGLTA